MTPRRPAATALITALASACAMPLLTGPRPFSEQPPLPPSPVATLSDRMTAYLNQVYDRRTSAPPAGMTQNEAEQALSLHFSGGLTSDIDQRSHPDEALRRLNGDRQEPISRLRWTSPAMVDWAALNVRQAAWNLFWPLDLNGDGRITAQEHFQATAPLFGGDPIKARRWFSDHDSNGDGAITYAERLESELASWEKTVAGS